MRDRRCDYEDNLYNNEAREVQKQNAYYRNFARDRQHLRVLREIEGM